MADLGATSWSEIDASNNAVPPDGWPEGMAPSDVNNAARSQMGGEKRWWDRSNATQTTTGTSTAYVLTYAATEAALYDGEETSFVLHVTCGPTPTLNRDGLGAKALRKFDFATNNFIAVAASDFRIHQVLRVRYNLADDRYDVIAAAFSPSAFPLVSTNNIFTGTNRFDNTVTMFGAAFNNAIRVDVASATTTDIGAAASNYVRITGMTTITGLGTIASGVVRTLLFAGAVLLTYNATSLILPAAANYTTVAGDVFEFTSEGAGNWRCTGYALASGGTLAPGSGTQVGRAYAQNVVFATLSTNIPYDDTIPQVTEGDLVLTSAITPKATTNRVRVTVTVPIGAPSGVQGVACAALFRNGGANAIDAKFIRLVDGFGTYPAQIMFEDSPGSVAVQTYTVRVGGASFDVLINGDISGRVGGGSSRASITLDEFVA